MLVRLLLGIGAALLISWLALLITLAVARPKGGLLKEALRLLPDLLRLLRRLATDAAVPRGARLRLWLLLVYLAIPIDVVPDFLPVLGYADDAIVVTWVLRSVVRRAGPEPVRRHWPGSPDGLAALWRLCGLPTDRSDRPLTCANAITLDPARRHAVDGMQGSAGGRPRPAGW